MMTIRRAENGTLQNKAEAWERKDFAKRKDKMIK